MPLFHRDRLGRTARAGGTAKGVGILILAPFETFFLRKPIISTLPLTPHPTIPAAELEQCRAALAKAMPLVGKEELQQHYAASLGFYKSSLRDAFRGDAGAMVRVFNEFATAPVQQGGLGCDEVPGSTSPFLLPRQADAPIADICTATLQSSPKLSARWVFAARRA